MGSRSEVARGVITGAVTSKVWAAALEQIRRKARDILSKRGMGRMGKESGALRD